MSDAIQNGCHSTSSSTSLWGDIPAIQWESTQSSLFDFVDNFKNPHMVKLELNEAAKDLHFGEAVNLNQPCLAFSHRRRTRIYAENLAWNYNKKMYAPKGEILGIPKDYMGWFEVLPRKKNDPSPEHYHQIAGIANSGAEMMLLCTLSVGFIGQVIDGELHLMSEEKLYPGEVLKIEKTITKKWKMVSLGGSEEDPSKQLLTQFLWCLDRRDRDIFLPFAHPGKFCAIAQQLTQEANVVYQVGTLSEMEFPLLVRLVFGWPPDNYPEFTGLLRLGGSFRMDTVVMHNMIEDKAVIIEIPVDVGIKMYKASNMEEIKESNTYQDILHSCCANVFPYVAGMKSLSVRYERMEKDSNADENETSAAKKPLMGRLARAMDMNGFSPLNIFPPPQEDTYDNVSDSWTLSFKDPEHLYDDIGNVIDENAVWVDVQGSGQSRAIRLSQTGTVKNTGESGFRGSVSCDMGQSFTIIPQDNIAMKPLPRLERQRDLRAKRERELRYREAVC